MLIFIKLKVTQLDSYSALFKFGTHCYAADVQTKHCNEEFIILQLFKT
jgi:hypothetical protein